MEKGIAYSTVIIVALLGILLVSIWSYSQLSSGAQYASTYSSRTSQDISVSRLEFTKRFLSQNLIFSSQSSSLDIAANGGTQFGATYWYCDSEPTPPEINEVNFAISNQSLSLLNAYIATIPDSEISKMGVQVSNYGCVGVYDPESTNCLQQDSSNCQGFQTSGSQGGTIDVTTPSPVQYSGSITADANSNRFYWIYYKLYDDTMKSGLLRSISEGMRAACPNRNMNGQARLEFALSKLCDHYETLFAEPDGTKYVKCEMQILCINTANPVACVNTPCERPQTNPLCWETVSQSPLNGEKMLSNFVDSLGGTAVQAQGGALAGIRVKVTLTDTKFNIPSSDGLQPLVWNLWAETQVEDQPCRPIDSGSQ